MTAGAWFCGVGWNASGHVEMCTNPEPLEFEFRRRWHASVMRKRLLFVSKKRRFNRVKPFF